MVYRGSRRQRGEEFSVDLEGLSGSRRLLRIWRIIPLIKRSIRRGRRRR